MAGGEFGKIYITTALINAASSTVNGALSRKQQKELALQNQQFTKKMETNRQNFQLHINQENAKIQREMSEKNHQLRLIEQQTNFENMCKNAEWQHFLKDWPLWVQPSVLRQEQILPDDTVALRVFFAKSSHKIFSGYIYPELEQGLLEFVDRYHNVFGSNNIIFYHNAYKENHYGGAINTNIRYALKELPVIIIDTNVLNEEICVSATVWGFGNAIEQHATVFKLPYKIECVEGKIDKESIKLLSNQLLAYLKFVLGYVYDTYNLIMYNQAPLLPKVAQYEFEKGILSAPVRYKGIQSAFREQYGEIYDAVLGIETLDREAGFAERPESFKKTVLHELRLEYAEAVKGFVPQEEYREILDESVKAWCEMRTTLSPIVFMESLQGEHEKMKNYFSENDIQYFLKLCECYSRLEQKSMIAKSCLALSDGIKRLEDSVITVTDVDLKDGDVSQIEDKQNVKTEKKKRRFIEL